MTQHDEVCANRERLELASDGYREDKDTPLVFNRAMQWLRPPGGNIICYCTGGNLPLTGENQVSRWVSHPANLIEAVQVPGFFGEMASTERTWCVEQRMSTHQESISVIPVAADFGLDAGLQSLGSDDIMGAQRRRPEV